MNLKLKYIISLVVVVAVALFISRNHSTNEEVAEVETSVESESADVTKPAVMALETTTTTAATEALAVAETKVDVKETKTLKKKQGISQKEIALETEKEFLSMTIPSEFSDVKEVRYKEMYDLYQKSNFYLNEVAAEHLDTSKENLLKAFKGLAIYYSENSIDDQTDSAIAIIKEEKAFLYEEAFKALSKKDKAIIKKLVKLQSESE
jgi:hypothetical protein